MPVLVLSPRVAPGLLSLAAWDLLRAAPRVLAEHDDEHVAALREAGITVEVVPPRGEDADDAGTVRVVVGDPPPGKDVLRGSRDLPGAHLLDLVHVMDRLRRECAWTAQQTHAGLTPYLLEEAHEVLEALDSADSDLLREELGDLLMQVVFHAAIAAQAPDGWDVDAVADGITAKLVRRNPHVFADGAARTPEEIDAAWQRVKAAEKPRTSPLDGIAPHLPALATAEKVLRRVPDLDTSGDDVGSALLRLVAQAHAQGLDAEGELRRAVRSRLQ